MEEVGLGDQVVKEFLGDMPTARFILFYGIALFGMFVQFAIQVDKAIKTNPRTPNKFQWRRLFSLSSTMRLIASVGVLAIGVVNYEGLVGTVFNATEPGPINITGALILGLGIDKLVATAVGAGMNLATKRK